LNKNKDPKTIEDTTINTKKVNILSKYSNNKLILWLKKFGNILFEIYIKERNMLNDYNNDEEFNLDELDYDFDNNNNDDKDSDTLNQKAEKIRKEKEMLLKIDINNNRKGNLSKGQQQLISIARALVNKPIVLIMDEPTASLDFETDNKVQKLIRNEILSSTTIICIAHRLKTVIDYDYIIMLDKGQLRESGTPSELIKNQSSLFYQMCLLSGDLEALEEIVNNQPINHNEVNINKD
jgi:ABC-type sugar transport system ATPase subunit